MFDSEYIKRLNKYIHKKISLRDKGDEVIIDIDAETKYMIRLQNQKYVLYMRERGSKSQISVFSSEKEMKREVALYLKNIYDGGIEYTHILEFDNIQNILLLQKKMNMHLNANWFSINKAIIDCINLQETNVGTYNLYFLDKNQKKYIIEQNEEAPFIFERFYCETEFYGGMLQRIKQYTEVFDESLDYKEIIEMLGY